MYYLITILLLFLTVVMAVKSLSRKHQQDSALKRRAVLSSHEQMTLTRLQTVLPKFTVLAHVSFDALLTTKYAHTRRKYQNMTADFVVLDQNYQVVVVVMLEESGLRRAHQQYERRLLQLAGYRVLSYSTVPDYHELRRDLLTPESEMATLHATPQLERISNAFVKS
ncbi:DUF2726 domain-containing protein [Acinetobacter baumannii]|uniref:DUF2726 domain-containing protein n=2 Tax=Acinetobacter baumannii TaxID=470 RepID=A0A9P2P456_ACIBA|nr:DUF2726 domain-containing protein [Acinetobacter baumannii]EHU2954361.1 DUF2726 domain-containing protein [Acinetobacter baumannii]EKT7960560.1 DUF2726 domain-containing protein [Acinetobacter baumannii]EKT9124995.1 DUF2726 domain-containing protein [Acinetobacter baumannii]EKT9273636.1 DUF2726 domain-containing protein [Acinetobacter baumannii]EKT9315601.1 DUF2726 domain-containing protein [Acinetobacter baumannii]